MRYGTYRSPYRILPEIREAICLYALYRCSIISDPQCTPGALRSILHVVYNASEISWWYSSHAIFQARTKTHSLQPYQLILGFKKCTRKSSIFSQIGVFLGFTHIPIEISLEKKKGFSTFPSFSISLDTNMGKDNHHKEKDKKKKKQPIWAWYCVRIPDLAYCNVVSVFLSLIFWLYSSVNADLRTLYTLVRCAQMWFIAITRDAIIVRCNKSSQPRSEIEFEGWCGRFGSMDSRIGRRTIWDSTLLTTAVLTTPLTYATR